MEETIIQNKPCKQCQASFDITDKDLEFYDKISPSFAGKKYLIYSPLSEGEGSGVRGPSLCPECRSKIRLSFRNENKLYKRPSSTSSKNILSLYSPDKEDLVYESDLWYSDKRDAMSYGQDFDFNQPFFQQFAELKKKVPALALNVFGNENCDYVNYCGYSKNCYLSYNTDYSENMIYCSNCIRCKDGIDLYKCKESSLCFDSVDLYNCHNVFHSQFCFDCADCQYLSHCSNCANCFGCINLINRKYCILNVQYEKDEYKKKLQEFQKMDKTKLLQTIQEFYLSHPHACLKGNHNEGCTGNYIFNSKNVVNSFDINDSENIKNCGTVNTVHHCHDRDHTGYDGSFCYQISSCGDRIHNTAFSANIWIGGHNVWYCILGISLQDCFACVGLRNKQYCILNKQYTKSEYETLVPRIIEHMIQTPQKFAGQAVERGEFFPAFANPFGYNESVAQDFFPLTKQEALKQGFNRSDYEAPFPQVEKTIQAKDVPSIKELDANGVSPATGGNILNQAIICEISGKPFRIIKQELDFYRKHHLPIPTKHPDQRHKERIALRNPRKLRDRTCMKCGIDIKTTYSPERPEIVWCEACYNKEIYG